MISSFFKLIFYTYLIINLFLLIICDIDGIDDCFFYNSFCNKSLGSDLEITYYSNGSINKECKNLFNNEIKISSIAYEDKLKLFIYDGSEEKCTDYDDDEKINSLECCKGKNKTDSQNVLCALSVKYINENKTYQGCFEVNEYEKERFKGITADHYKSFNSTEKPIAYLFCNSELYQIKKLIFFLLFIYIYF